MYLTGQKGSILILVIIAMTLIAALGAGIYSVTSSSTYSEFLSNSNDNAYELARAGVRYAVRKFQCSTFQSSTYYMPDADHTFTITGEPGKITSVGIVRLTLFMEAKRVIVYDISASCSGSGMPVIGTPSQFGDMPGFSNPVISNPGAPSSQQSIQANLTDNTVSMGGGVTDASGTLLYQGSSVVGNCNQGACGFNIGVNVYFEFTSLTEDYSTDSRSFGEGFTFAVISALNNTSDRSGGATPGNSMGELAGYAGPGTTADGLGLVPPKMALEFDTYPNDNGFLRAGKKAVDDICLWDSRNDANTGVDPPTSFRDHIAVMYWGARTISGTCGGYNKSSFDDNRHGAGGTGSDPQNSVKPGSPDPASGHYELAGARGYTCKSSANTCNWLEDGHKYNTRIEIVRSGAGTYRFKAWVLSQNPGCTSVCYNSLSTVQQSHLQDIMVPFSDASPQIDRTVALSAQDHSDFDRIFFGFTEATGGSSQQITVENVRVFFPTGTCNYTTDLSVAYKSGTDVSHTLTSANYDASSGTGIITTQTSATCPWMVFSIEPWIHITSSISGMGTGDFSFSVDANTGPARTGHINIAGHTFTINQAGGCGNPQLSASNNQSSPLASTNGSSGTVSLTAGNGCPWTAGNNGNGWLTVTPASGTGTGAAQQITFTATATGAPRNAGITIGGQNFQVYQNGCQYVITTHACYTSNRIYLNANITGGTPASVTWTVTGPGSYSANGTLASRGGTLWGGASAGCGLSNAVRTSSNVSTNGTYTVTVTGSGVCSSGSNPVPVTRP